MDYGHAEADRLLKRLERKLSKEYKTAYKEMKAKADAYFSKFAEDDAKKLADMKAGKITPKQYSKWRADTMLAGKEYKKMVDVLAKDLTNVNKIAMSMVDEHTPTVYALNYNYGGYEMARGLNENFSFQLADHKTAERLMKENPKLLPKVNVPKDMRWNQRKMRSALLQGVLQGDSVDKIANRLQGVTTMSKTAALRNARTMTTGAENAGRVESYHEAAKLGIEVQKQWIATLDSRTRASHAHLDGEVREDEYFSNGLMYPADPNGDHSEVYNCRCTIICKVMKHEYDMSGRASKLGNTSYEEWKNGHRG